MEDNRLLVDILDCVESEYDLRTLLFVAESQFRLQGGHPPGLLAFALRKMSCGSNDHVFGETMINTERVTIYRCRKCHSLQCFVNDKMRFGDLWHVSLGDFSLIDRRIKDVETAKKVSKQIDVGMMQTDEGRKLARHLNRESESLQLRLHRLNTVYQGYDGFVDSLRFDLSDAAGIWAIATLAKHPDRDECQANFFAFVDIAFSAIAKETEELSPPECERLRIASESVQKHVSETVGRIITESQQEVAKKDKSHVSYLAAQSLLNLRTAYVEFVPSHLLAENMLACCAMCVQLDAVWAAAKTEDNVLEDIIHVTNTALQCGNDVMARVKSGELKFVDGRLTQADG